MQTVQLVRSVKGAARADVRTIGADSTRRVVWIEIEETVRRGALSADASFVIETAARTAVEKKMPLVMVVGSSGADIVEGIAALEDIAHTDASRTNNDIWLPWLATELTKLGLKPLPSVGNFVSVGFGSKERAAAANDWLMKDGLIPRMIAGYGMPEFLRITVGTEKEVKLVQESLAHFVAANK